MKRFSSIPAAVLLGTVLAVCDAGAGDIQPPYVIVRGRRIAGREVRADSQGNIRLITPEGVTMTFDPGTVAVVDEPANFAELNRMVEAGRYEEAIGGLREIMNRYRFLGWDQRARRLLARAQVGTGQHALAVRTLEELFETQPAARAEPLMQDAYLVALHGAGESEKLLPLLDETVRTGGRQPAARAQLMRANLRLRNEEIEPALFDFLRITTLFRNLSELQPEALYQAAVCFEKLGYTERAANYFERLARDYPDSEFARRKRDR